MACCRFSFVFSILGLGFGLSSLAHAGDRGAMTENEYQKALREISNKQDSVWQRCKQNPKAKAACSDDAALLSAGYSNPTGSRAMAFPNFTDHGVCWGHTLFHRRALALMRFAPDQPKLSQADFKRRITRMMSGDVVTIPGYSSLNELTAMCSPNPEDPSVSSRPECRVLAERIESEWSGNFFSPANLGIATHKRSPSANLEGIKEAEKRLKAGEKPVLLVQFSLGGQHIVMINSIERKQPDGQIYIHAVDSNFPDGGSVLRFSSDGTLDPLASQNTVSSEVDGNQVYSSAITDNHIGLKIMSKNEYKIDLAALKTECCEKMLAGSADEGNPFPAPVHGGAK